MSDDKRTGRPLLLSFSGIDGAGKSSQIENLISHLEGAGQSIRLVTFWDDVVLLKGLREGAGHTIFKGDKGVGSPEAPIHRKDKNVRSPWITLFRMAFYLFDTLSLRRTVSRTRRSGADVVLFDRYVFDELANLDLGNPAMRLYIRFLLWLTPKPDISFVLDADPAQAFARKPEYPLAFLHSNRNAYLRMGQMIGATVIPPSTLQAAKAAVLGRVLQQSSGS